MSNLQKLVLACSLLVNLIAFADSKVADPLYVAPDGAQYFAPFELHGGHYLGNVPINYNACPIVRFDPIMSPHDDRMDCFKSRQLYQDGHLQLEQLNGRDENTTELRVYYDNEQKYRFFAENYSYHGKHQHHPYLQFQSDGNLVKYETNRHGRDVVWSSGTAGHPNSLLLISPDASISIVAGVAAPTTIWHQAGSANATHRANRPTPQPVHPLPTPSLIIPGHSTNRSAGYTTYEAGLTLRNGQALRSSDSSGTTIELMLQADNNLVEYSCYDASCTYGYMIGETGTNLSGGRVATARLELGYDGNLLIKDAADQVLFSWQDAGASLDAIHGAHLVLYADGGIATWGGSEAHSTGVKLGYERWLSSYGRSRAAD